MGKERVRSRVWAQGQEETGVEGGVVWFSHKFGFLTFGMKEGMDSFPS